MTTRSKRRKMTTTEVVFPTNTIPPVPTWCKRFVFRFVGLSCISALVYSEALGDEKELIMFEYQPILPGRLVKRQAIYVPDQPEQQQYFQERQDTQVPDEYLSLLQQIEAQQGHLNAGPQPIQQILTTRGPQQFVGQPIRPPQQRQSPLTEQQRRLQESVVQKNVREQETRDEQRQQLIQLGIDPQYLRQLQLYEAAQRQRLQTQQHELDVKQQFVQVPQQQYVQPEIPQIPQPQYAQQIQEPAAATPERISYSQVRFGTTKLNPQPLIPQPSQRAVFTAPKAQPAPAQELVYTQVRPQQLLQPAYRQPVYVQQENFEPAIQKTVDVKQHPEQYLIETTKPQQPQEQYVAIPRQQIYYRPQPNYEEIQANLAQQQSVQYAQPSEASTTARPSPSRSSIFVTTSRTPVDLKPTYANQQIEEVRLPKSERRQLSQSEVNALINAGFKVTPAQEYQRYEQNPAYYRGIGKRQNKPIPRPVQLTEQERLTYARQGITNLYRVDAAESQNSPATYVLAIGGPSSRRQ